MRQKKLRRPRPAHISARPPFCIIASLRFCTRECDDHQDLIFCARSSSNCDEERMKRLEFIAATVALLVSPRRSWAQGPRRRVGFLAIGDGSGKALNRTELALLDGLRNHGWIDGRNLTMEYRFSDPPGRLPASVAELIAFSPDVLIAAASTAAVALKSATATIPIVFVAVADPVVLGLVQNLSRPGGNITGLTTFVPVDFVAKRIEILRELVPGA